MVISPESLDDVTGIGGFTVAIYVLLFVAQIVWLLFSSSLDGNKDPSRNLR
jgi:hypothetical protein